MIDVMWSRSEYLSLSFDQPWLISQSGTAFLILRLVSLDIYPIQSFSLFNDGHTSDVTDLDHLMDIVPIDSGFVFTVILKMSNRLCTVTLYLHHQNSDRQWNFIPIWLEFHQKICDSMTRTIGQLCHGKTRGGNPASGVLRQDNF